MPKPISRRALLRGVGAAMSLPWLESISSGQNLAEPPLRMGFMFMPNGVRPDGDFFARPGCQVRRWPRRTHGTIIWKRS